MFLSVVGSKVKLQDAGFTYTRLSELLKEKLNELSYSSADFGVHSVRAGSLIAVAGSGMPDRLFKKHGHRRSEDSLVKHLQITKQIGF